MSSAGARCVHVLHVSTQIPYAVTVAVISFICYVIAGFVQSAALCLLLGAVMIVGFLFFMKKRVASAAV